MKGDDACRSNCFDPSSQCDLLAGLNEEPRLHHRPNKLERHASRRISRAAIVVVTALLVPLIGAGQSKKAGNPETNLPPNIIQFTAFGERPVVSPDGKRVAFMGKSFGDAFEIDLETRMIRLLTGHFHHEGFLRVHYLPNSDFFLIGAQHFLDIRSTREHDQEMWVMKPEATVPPLALNRKISEGVAILRTRMKIAWANTHGQYPDQLAPGEAVLYTADITKESGVPELANKKEVLRAQAPECTLEAQDFRNDDRELIYTCYRQPHFADVMGVDLETGKITTYRKIPDEYNEVEGVSPDGKWALIESSREQGKADRKTRGTSICGSCGWCRTAPTSFA